MPVIMLTGIRFNNHIFVLRMKSKYISPTINSIGIGAINLICLSLTGGTEPLNQSDLEDLIIDEPLDL